MITMASYESPLAVVVIAVAWKLNALYPGESVFSLHFTYSHEVRPLGGTTGTTNDETAGVSSAWNRGGAK